MRVLVAPAEFAGTLSAPRAAEAMADGWARGDPAAEVASVAVADGGPGTLDALVRALGGDRRSILVDGPLGDPVAAQFALLEGDPGLGATPGRGPTAVVELARASGLGLVGPDRRDALRATTRGTGALILAAARARATRIVVALGGSASTDGGAGIAQALGIRLLDADGRDLPTGGRALVRLSRIDATGLAPEVRAVEVVAACDVASPLGGPTGAARLFGPQKGASPDDVLDLERGLVHLAAVILRDLGVDVRDLPGAGAAGGAGAGLAAFLGARLRPGADLVLEALGIEGRIGSADLVVTGEGRFDRGSLEGKAPHAVGRLAHAAGRPWALLCGEIAPDVDSGTPHRFSLAERFGAERAREDAAMLLEQLASEAAMSLREG